MKQLKIALALLLAVSTLAGAGSAAFADSATATAQGLEETVSVTLTMEDGVITSVDAQTDKEEESLIGNLALKKVPEAMLEANSVNVDAISGATSTSNAVISAATSAYMELIGTQINLDAWAKGKGYVKAEDFSMITGVDAITSATESGKGGINFGDIDLSDELKRELVLEYLKGAENNYREMYQIATAYNNVPTIGSVEYVLDPADLSLFGSSETNTAMLNPNVDLYWTRQIRAGDVCAEDAPVLPTYFMSYGVQITGTYRRILFAELGEDEIPVFVNKARVYFDTLTNTASLADMSDDDLYAYLCTSPMNFYQIVPSRIVITSPWFLKVYDSGYARQFISRDLQDKLAAAVAEQYPEAEGLTMLDFATYTAIGLKTQQILNFLESD